MRAIHIICRRQGIILRNLVQSKSEKGIYTSACWALHNLDDPNQLVDGWIYLHPTSKNSPSEFGGLIRSIQPCTREDAAREAGVAFVFEAMKEGRGQLWRGEDHGMAWTGGIVDATYAHEIT
jgi:hypothetical protein